MTFKLSLEAYIAASLAFVDKVALSHACLVRTFTGAVTTMSTEVTENYSAFRFHGSWQEFARIAFPNLLLTIVTLGIYRFWATTRERDYLWSKTEFIDERLEWTGRGIELFIGFLMAFLLIGVPFIVIQLVSQGLIFRGEVLIAGLVTLTMFLLAVLPDGRRLFPGASLPP